MSNFEIISKFGGTSAAQPEAVRRHVEHEEPSIVVVSAPGLDSARGYNRKVTDLLIDVSLGLEDPGIVKERYTALALDMGLTSSNEAEDIVGAIPSDISSWQEKGWPLAALGEYWSARLYAVYLGREFADAAEFIRLNGCEELDIASSEELIRERFDEDRLYVAPGFYGADVYGVIRTLGRGGSDITPAIIARALGSEEVHNWSDVDGFMSCDPRRFTGAVLLDRLSYEDAIQLNERGCQLLHATACSILGNTAVRTIMRNTFGEIGNRGTELQSAEAYTFA